MPLEFEIATDRQKNDTLVVPVRPAGPAGTTYELCDAALGGLLTRTIKAGDLKRPAGSVASVPTPGHRLADRILLVSSGDNDAAVSAATFRSMCEAAAQALSRGPGRRAGWYLLETPVADHDLRWQCHASVAALGNAAYRFSAQRKQPPRDVINLRRVRIARPPRTPLRSPLAEAGKIAAANDFCRDLGNQPPNVCDPAWLAQQARQLVRGVRNAKATIVDAAGLRKAGCGALLAVAAGSRKPPRLIILEYHGTSPARRPLALVGKGITFDTGGISLKPGPAMDEMKFDMCGAAAVLGAFKAAVTMALPINLVALVAAAENMPDGNATRPGDVVRSMSGQTIEILNTDAEGRLVLCDAISWAMRFKPAAVVDVATLTGAQIVALGSVTSALYANNDRLADQLQAAGDWSGDRAWRMPLFDAYQPALHSNFADMANIGGRGAGGITAACFLSRFVPANTPWAHLDIAGPAFRNGPTKGATGRPVPLLTEWLIQQARGA